MRKKLTNEQVKTKILERLKDSRLELIDFDYSIVGRICLGKRSYKTHKGWIFRYVKDGEFENVA